MHNFKVSKWEPTDVAQITGKYAENCKVATAFSACKAAGPLKEGRGCGGVWKEAVSTAWWPHAAAIWAVHDAPWARCKTGAEKYFIKTPDYFLVSFWRGSSISKKAELKVRSDTECY